MRFLKKAISCRLLAIGWNFFEYEVCGWNRSMRYWSEEWKQVEVKYRLSLVEYRLKIG